MLTLDERLERGGFPSGGRSLALLTLRVALGGGWPNDEQLAQTAAPLAGLGFSNMLEIGRRERSRSEVAECDPI